MPVIRVMVSGHDSPIQVSVPPQASVWDLCQALYASNEAQLSQDEHRLRFINSGKNLLPTLETIESAGVTDGTFVHCVVTTLAAGDRPFVGAQNVSDPCDEEEGMVTIDLGDVSESMISDGSFYDWLWGFILGALLGLIMMVLAKDRSIALSGKWKRGIGYGTLVNVLFGLFLLASDRTD